MSVDYEPPRQVLSLWRGKMLVTCSTRKPLGELLSAFCARHRLSEQAMLSRDRGFWITKPRQDFWREAYETGHYSLTRLGQFFGRDHTSVLHGIRRSRERLQKQ